MEDYKNVVDALESWLETYEHEEDFDDSEEELDKFREEFQRRINIVRDGRFKDLTPEDVEFLFFHINQMVD